MISYILWDQSAELFSIGQFTLRWNGLLLLVAFIIGRQVLVYSLKKEGKPSADADILITYLIVGILIGARLGYAIVYEPQLWAKPMTLFLPLRFKPSFQFVGMTGFSSHGALLGILAGAWLFSFRGRAGRTFLSSLDRVALVGPLIAVPLLVGSFLNSEIEGKPTGSAIGTVAVRPVTEGLMKLPCCIMRTPGGDNPLSEVIVKRNKDVAIRENGNHSIALYFFFKHGSTVQTVDEFLLGDVKTYLYDRSQWINEPGTEPLHYAVFQEPNGDYEARVRTIGVARYPVQLFEAAAFLVLFGLLFWYWNRHRATVPPGRVFGWCMIVVWTVRFGLDFLNANQSYFTKGMVLTKSQVLSLPMIIAGGVVLMLTYRKNLPTS